MSRDAQAGLAFVVGFALLVTGLLAFDQHCVRTQDHDVVCRAASRALQVVAPQKF